MRWAQRINNNRKRRRGANRSSSGDVTLSQNTKTKAETGPCKPLDGIVIFCSREGTDDDALVIPSRGLLTFERELSNDARIRELQYDEIVERLKDRLDSDPDRETLWYRPRAVTGWKINHQDAWEAALQEMWVAGLTRMPFVVEPRPESKIY